MNMIKGVFLPIITPFKDYTVDYNSYKKLITHYLAKGISGLVVSGTTGECPTISEEEFFPFIECTLEQTAGKIPVYAGLSSNNTTKALKTVQKLNSCTLNGLLVSVPYYNRPSQEGLYTYFRRIADSTDMEILLYNIPYRTGVNLENDTLYRLAETTNITGIKDSCGIVQQSLELLINRPAGFSVLTGEDILFFLNLTHGGQGGIMAAAHLFTETYVKIFALMEEGSCREAFTLWQTIYNTIPLLFREPNPAPLKYALKRLGLIASEETREPLTGISPGLKQALDQVIAGPIAMPV